MGFRLDKYDVDSNGCWIHRNKATNRGYVKLTDDKHRSAYAHRVSYEKHVGPIPEGMDILHSCDVPKCINPEHLKVGTHQDNMKDKRGKYLGRSSNHKSPEYIEELVVYFKETRENISNRDIGKLVGISHPTVGRILKERMAGV